MTFTDLVFILAVLACLFTLLALCYFLLRRQWTRVRRTLLALGSFLVIYAIVLVSVALLSPQHVYAMHQNRCFDDWCISAEQVTQQATMGASSTAVSAHGMYYVVTVRVSSKARGITQRALDARLYLLDAQGQRYDPDPTAQRALDAAGQSGQPLNSSLTPGSSFTHTVAFDLPKNSSQLALGVTHGLFPGVIIIGDEQSFLHKPTTFKLRLS